MAASVIQTVNDGSSGSTGSSINMSYASDVTAGNVSILSIGYIENGTRVTDVTDNLGNTYIRRALHINGTRGVELWAALNITGGSCTVTVTWSSSKSCELTILEVGGVGTAAFITAFGNASDSGTSHSASSLTTRKSGTAIFICSGQTGGAYGSFTPGTGYSSTRSGAGRSIVENKPVTSSDTNSGAYTTGNSTGAVNILIAIETGPAPAVSTSFKIGSFTSPSAVGFVKVSDVGFEPKAVIIWGNGATNITQTPLDTDTFVVGFTKEGPTKGFGYSISGTSTDNSASTQGGAGMDTKNPLKLSNGSTGGSDYNAQLGAIEFNGFTLLFTSSLGSTGNFLYLAIAGDSVSTSVGSFADATGTGNQSITGVGFKPDLIILAPSIYTISNGATGNYGIPLGWGNKNSAVCISTQSVRQAAPTATSRYQRTNKIIGAHLTNSGTIGGEATLVSLDSDGFTLNWTTAPGTAFLTGYLAIKGIKTSIGSFNQPTSTGDQSIIGLGQTPAAILFASYNTTSQSTVQSGSRLSVGSKDASTGFCSANGNLNAVNPSAGARVITNSNSLISMTPNATGGSSTIDAAATVASLDSSGFTLNWNIVDATQREWIYLAMAPASGGGNANKGGGGGKKGGGGGTNLQNPGGASIIPIGALMPDFEVNN